MKLYNPKFLIAPLLLLSAAYSNSHISTAKYTLSPFVLVGLNSQLNTPASYATEKYLDLYALSDWKSFEKNITFKDIIGGVPQEIEDLKQFIENSQYYRDAGAIMPRGYLFYGPPGTGKTLLAAALAGELDAAFLAKSGSSFVAKYLGEGPANVRATFDWARNELRYGGAKHAIIFIDEFDAIGRRSSDDSAAGKELNNTINEFLVQMDGFNSNDNIIVIGASNHPDLIDEALKRPGRFEYHIKIDLPDTAKREALLRHYVSPKFNRKVSSDVNFAEYAQMTEGFNCADIASLANRAAIYVARRKQTVITNEALLAAVQEIKKQKNA